jgi:predicted DNA-binding ArsR family transcriptional regulator
MKYEIEEDAYHIHVSHSGKTEKALYDDFTNKWVVLTDLENKWFSNKNKAIEQLLHQADLLTE